MPHSPYSFRLGGTVPGGLARSMGPWNTAGSAATEDMPRKPIDRRSQAVGHPAVDKGGRNSVNAFVVRSGFGVRWVASARAAGAGRALSHFRMRKSRSARMAQELAVAWSGGRPAGQSRQGPSEQRATQGHPGFRESGKVHGCCCWKRVCGSSCWMMISPRGKSAGYRGKKPGRRRSRRPGRDAARRGAAPRARWSAVRSAVQPRRLATFQALKAIAEPTVPFRFP